jgi:uncharacterized cupredoxin-like copper-binding protein
LKRHTVWSYLVLGNQARRRRRGPIVWAALLVVLSSCSGAGRDASWSTVGVTLNDFSINTSALTVKSGGVTFDIYNKGPTTHEFVVVRTPLRDDQLPIAADGLSIDEEALALVGEISDVHVWTDYTLELRLSPGRYVLFCNLDGHYLGGMTGTLLVSDDG